MKTRPVYIIPTGNMTHPGSVYSNTYSFTKSDEGMKRHMILRYIIYLSIIELASEHQWFGCWSHQIDCDVKYFERTTLNVNNSMRENYHPSQLAALYKMVCCLCRIRVICYLAEPNHCFRCDTKARIYQWSGAIKCFIKREGEEYFFLMNI